MDEENFPPEIAQYLEKRTPENTKRVNESSISALISYFICDADIREEFINDHDQHMIQPTLTDPVLRRREAIRLLKKRFFTGALPGQDVPVHVQENIRRELIPFVISYKSKKTGKSVTPVTMKTYILGLQRQFSEWGYELTLVSGPIFDHKKYGLRAVCDNRFSEQQAQGQIRKQHNVFPRSDVIHLLNSKSCSKSTPRSYINRLVIIVGVSLGVRPTALHELEMHQFQKIELARKLVWRYTEKIGSKTGASKVAKGGWKDTKYKPVQIDMVDFPVLDGTLNVFEEVDQYMQIRSEMPKQNPRFFLQPSRKDPSTLKPAQFFNNQPIGVNSFQSLVKNMCIAEKIRGNGVHEYVTNHGLRGTMTSLLLDAGFSDTAVSLRTGHRNNDSLKSYKNNQGSSSFSQQKAIFETTKFEDQNAPSRAKDAEDVKIRPYKRIKNESDGIDAEDVEEPTGIAIQGVSGGNFTFHVHQHLSK